MKASGRSRPRDQDVISELRALADEFAPLDEVSVRDPGSVARSVGVGVFLQMRTGDRAVGPRPRTAADAEPDNPQTINRERKPGREEEK